MEAWATEKVLSVFLAVILLFGGVSFAIPSVFGAFPLSATAQGPDSIPEKAQVVSVLGKIPGKDLIVHVWVVVPPGADKNEAANEALRNQGARQFTPDEFSTIALFWDQFSDGDPGNDFVTQNYNPNNDPTIDQGKITLLKTHITWNGVVTSSFNFAYGVDTTRCPSLVQECPGPQTFDGNNDVAWLALAGPNTLGVAWSGTSIDEVDIALNTQFPWNTNGNDFDVETVYLHENGHALGLGHSNVVGAVMEPAYDGVRRLLLPDDVAGITFLYPVVNSAPSVTISSPAAPVTINVGDSQTFTGTASDAEDGDVTLSLVWVSDLDGQIGTGGSFSTTALTAGVHIVTATATDSLSATGNAIAPTVTVNSFSLSPLAVDSVSSTSSNRAPVFSWSHTTGSGTDRLLVVSTSVGDNPGTVTSITYGGTALTKLRSDVNIDADTATELWYLINPASGATTIKVTMSDKGSAIGGSISFKGVDQTAPFSNNVGAIGTGTSASVVVTSATDEMVVSVLAILEGDGSATPVSGQNELWDLIGKDVEGAGSTETGATSVTMSWTKDDNDWAISAASIKPATVGPPPPPNASPVLTVPALPTNVNELAPFGFTATATDPDVPAQTLTFSLVNEPLGALIDPVSGDFTWTPTEAQGPATYTFDVKVTDSGSPPLSDLKTVTVTVDEVNVAPVANSQSVTTNEDTSVAITLSGTDADIPVQVLTFSLVNGPTNGVLSGIAPSLTYTPNTNFNGFDSFTFTISDGIATSDIASVTITVTAVNDAPVAVNDSYTANEDAPLTIIASGVLGNDTDTENDLLTAVLDTTTSNGSLTLNSDGSFTYTPNANFNGADTFTYHADDGTAGGNTATVTITVDPVNDTPEVDAQSVTTTENTLVAITLTGSDVDGDALTFSIVTGPSPGTLSGLNPSAGTVTYTPATNFNGADSFTFKVNDGLVDSNIATVTITVNPVNDAPVAVNDSVSTPEDTSITIDVLLNDTDADNDALTVFSVDTISAQGGSIINNGVNVAYTPPTNFNGIDTFTYIASDGTTQSNSATVTVTVTPVNDIPVANADTATTPEDTAVTINVLANDSDVDGDALTISSVTQGANGAVAINGITNDVTYTPNLNFFGTDSFSYSVSDGNGGTATATVSVTVNPAQPSDVVTIEKAEFRADKGELRVEATSTDFTATLSVYNASLELIDVMVSDGLGNYELRKDVANPGATITVISSSGGTATFTF